MAIVTTVSEAQRRPATIDALAKGLDVAKSLLGVDVDTQKLKLLQAEHESKSAAAKAEAEATRAAADPMSPISQSIRANARATGLRVPEGAPARDLEKGSLLYESMMASRKAELERQGKAGQLAMEKRLPADKVLSVNEGNVIPNMLGDIRQTIAANEDTFGPVAGRLASANPWNEKTKTMDAQLRSAAQAFGRYMEGGVLRKEDEEKYQKMFPQLTDTPAVAQNKLDLVDRLLKNKQASNIEALKLSGYDTRGVSGNADLRAPSAPQVLTRGSQKSGQAIAGGDNFSAEDLKVFERAKQRIAANPKDAKAIQVLSILRAKGLF